MQVRRGVEMLAVMVMVLLASSVSDGVVLNKCELEKQLAKAQLNSTEVAKIVCHVQQTSGFNTSMVNHLNVTEDEAKHPGGRNPPISNHTSHHSTAKQDKVTGQAEHHDGAGRNENRGGRRSRAVKSIPINATKPPISNHTSHHSTSKQDTVTGQAEHHEGADRNENHLGVRKPAVKTVRINPAKRPNSNLPPHTDSSEDNTDDHEDVHHVHPTTLTPQTQKSRPEATPGLNSSRPQDGSNNSTSNNSTSNNSTSNISTSNNSTSNISTSNNSTSSNSTNNNFRKTRSLRQKSPSSNHPLPEHGPPEHGPQVGSFDSAHAGGSEESRDHEDDDDDGRWTFYGLFQLADHVVCASGNKTSLNLCGMSCDDLTDDIITDDIACVRTIINSTLSMEDGSTPFNKLIKQMYDVLHDCDTKMASQNFVSC
ncbi:uncharacterized protein LOC143493420 [Brachyhypopomus gauderio]|uniref:uncharacterized protein LOC143493420 n=1 Tax=Brachyhypopomus gauderio TaxID=698409 RepID=UPI0040414A4B